MLCVMNFSRLPDYPYFMLYIVVMSKAVLFDMYMGGLMDVLDKNDRIEYDWFIWIS